MLFRYIELKVCLVVTVVIKIINKNKKLFIKFWVREMDNYKRFKKKLE